MPKGSRSFSEPKLKLGVGGNPLKSCHYFFSKLNGLPMEMAEATLYEAFETKLNKIIKTLK